MVGAPLFCACVWLSCSEPGKREKAQRAAVLELENPVMLFPSSLCHRVQPGVCLRPVLSGCLYSTFLSYTGCPVRIWSLLWASAHSKVHRGPMGCRFVTVLSLFAWLSEGPCASAEGWSQGESPEVQSAGVPWLLRCCTWQAGDCCWVTC